MGMIENFFFANSQEREAQSEARGRYRAGRAYAERVMQPYTQAGKDALQRLESLQQNPERIRDLPGYQFRMQEQGRMVEQSAAAKGGLFSGSTLEALARKGQEIASDEFNKERSFLMQLAEMGMKASGAQVGVSTEMAKGEAATQMARLERIAQHEQGGIDIIKSWSSGETWMGGGMGGGGM